jgi:hypothetical protein
MMHRPQHIFEFIDAKHQQAFFEQGYVSFPLLQKEEVQDLISLYESMEANIEKKDLKIFATGENVSMDLAKQTSDRILAIISPVLLQKLKAFDPLLAAFIVKPAEQNKADNFDWHQDLSFVDETCFESAQVWIALQDITYANGALQVIPKTHVYKDFIRTAPFYPSYFEAYFKDIIKKPHNVFLKAGEVVIFNHKLLHSSPANTSNKERMAVLLSIKVPKADWQYCLWDQEHENVKVYNADTHFYLQLWTNKKIQEENLKKQYAYTFPKMTIEEWGEWEKTASQGNPVLKFFFNNWFSKL